MNTLYDKLIADAAREYIQAHLNLERDYNPDYFQKEIQCLKRLKRIVQAEKLGLDPQEMKD